MDSEIDRLKAEQDLSKKVYDDQEVGKILDELSQSLEGAEVELSDGSIVVKGIELNEEQQKLLREASDKIESFLPKEQAE